MKLFTEMIMFCFKVAHILIHNNNNLLKFVENIDQF